MNREDEMIRDALKLDINASEELNNRILRTVERKKRGYGFLRTVASVAACLIVLLGSVTIVDAATGGRLYNAIKEKFEKKTYVFENGSKTIVEIIRWVDEDWERVTYVDENVILYRPISQEEAGFGLYLKVVDRIGRNCFISLETLWEVSSEEELYYAIRGGFRSLLTGFREPDEKRQVLEGLHEAAEHAGSETVKKALTDLASDLEGDRRIFYEFLPGEHWGEEGYIVFFEDLTEYPDGDAAIIVDPVDDSRKSWIFTVRIDKNLIVKSANGWVVSAENDYRDLIDNGIPVYDLREKK